MLKVKKRLDASRLLFTFAVFLKDRNRKATAKEDSFSELSYIFSIAKLSVLL